MVRFVLARMARWTEPSHVERLAVVVVMRVWLATLAAPFAMVRAAKASPALRERSSDLTVRVALLRRFHRVADAPRRAFGSTFALRSRWLVSCTFGIALRLRDLVIRADS